MQAGALCTGQPSYACGIGARHVASKLDRAGKRVAMAT